ncbi:MAG: LptF/LptG family permease [Planctomycetaceae bacterium]
MTTLDRHLLVRFLHAAGVYFIAAFGLYVVVDGFINLDDFQHRAGDGGITVLLQSMAWHYSCQASALFELFGPTAAMLGVSTTIAMLSRHGELHPILAAGIPTYRLSWPFVFGMVIANAALIANQELVIPRIASQLQGVRGGAGAEARQVESCQSPEGIYITGDYLFLEGKRIQNAEFRLFQGALADDIVSITAAEAHYFPADGKLPSGWYLSDIRPRFVQLPLTPAGLRMICPRPETNDVFITTSLTFEELYSRGASFKYLATADLLSRARRPAATVGSHQRLLLTLHGRFLRPAIMLVGIYLVFPVILRRESRSLVTDIGLCTLLMALIFGTTQSLRFLGQAGLVSTELASWLPLMVAAAISSWLTPLIKT